MSKLEYTEMDNIDKTKYNDESFYINVSDCKKTQETDQDEDVNIPILTTSDPEKYKNMVANIKKAGEIGHEAILQYLNDINFGIGDYVQKEGSLFCEGKKVTVFKIILEKVSNGHDLILQILNSVVKKIPPKKCSKCVDSKKDPDAQIEIDLQPMFQRAQRSTIDPNKDEFNRCKIRLIRDLLDIQSKRGDDNNINQIFQHPVIEILILKKWQIHQWSYIGKVRFFAMIVFLFTFFVRLRLLEEDQKRCFNAFYINEGDTTNMTDCKDYLEDPTDWTSKWIASTDETTRPFNRLLIFKYKETSFTIFAVTMGLVVFTQLCYFIREFFEAWNAKTSQSKKRRMIQFLKFNFANLFYLSLVISLVCISNPILTLKYFILLFWLVLVLSEIRQLCCLVFRPAWQGLKFKFLKQVLQHRYFRDPENYLEIFLLVSIPIAVYSDTWARNPEDKQYDGHARLLNREALFRGVVAIGVFAAWTELFIKLGNVSHSVVGDFTKMFYNIIKSKLLAYMQVCILLMVAFSLAFWIILEGHLKKDGVDFSKGFWVNLVLTVTMSTGEFNTGDFYENIVAENDVTKIFAMLFLIGLVILSTITMINLLVAAIISDFQTMKDRVNMENLLFITEYIIEEGEYQRLIYIIFKRNTFAMKYFDSYFNEDVVKKITHCPHLTCNRHVCKIEPLPIAKPGWSYNQAAREREPLLLRILEIRKGQEKGKEKPNKGNEDGDGDENEELCVYHKYGLIWSRSINGDLVTYRADNRNSIEMKTNSTIALSTTSLEMKTNGTIAIAITPSAM